MSEVKKITRYFQRCDLCGNEIELTDDKSYNELEKVRLPAIHYSQTERSKSPTVVWLSVCDKCLNELNSLISTKWLIDEFEYGGIEVAKV